MACLCLIALSAQHLTEMPIAFGQHEFLLSGAEENYYRGTLLIIHIKLFTGFGNWKKLCKAFYSSRGRAVYSYRLLQVM